jgi:ubiquinone/menaquinone biosynthesis C-methylase UbiE
MDDLELIIDLHKGALRLGPGSSEETGKALKLTNLNLSEDLKIADIGCGSGAQTLELARLTRGKIIAVDLFPEFLEKVKEYAEEEGYKERINTLQCSMDDLPFEEESLDLIWSEGAIYNMGFQKGLLAWRKFLKPGGYIAVSEITWLKEDRPPELEQFWSGTYSEMHSLEVKKDQLKNCGYELVGNFTISENSWLENYYTPMLSRIPDFLKRHQEDKNAEDLVKEEQHEIDLFKKYKDYYGYVFYIAKKI